VITEVPVCLWQVDPDPYRANEFSPLLQQQQVQHSE
jgi:hypothetical protein